ncbi:MAG: DMT family transporter [Prevotellaceae bacterium]|jgi:drug/metabolite transporter (DMT)-like permease|nr:DMT family transporter [Prevotellaceae bacterium]
MSIFVYLAIILSMTFWGMSFIWTDSLLQAGYPPMSVVLIRLILVAILLGGTCMVAGKIEKIQPGDRKFFLLMAVLEPFLYFIGETYGIKITGSPTLASLVVSLIPLFSPIAGIYFYNEKLSRNNLLGIVLSIVGVCIALAANENHTQNVIAGVSLFMLAVVSAIFYSVVIKKLADRYNPFTIVVYQNVIGIFCFLPFVLIFERSELFAVPFAVSSAFPFLMLAVLSSSLAFLLFIVAIKTLGITKANIFVTLIPILTMFFAYLTAGKPITAIGSMGVCVVVAGLILSQRRVKKAIRQSSEER